MNIMNMQKKLYVLWKNHPLLSPLGASRASRTNAAPVATPPANVCSAHRPMSPSLDFANAWSRHFTNEVHKENEKKHHKSCFDEWSIMINIYILILIYSTRKYQYKSLIWLQSTFPTLGGEIHMVLASLWHGTASNMPQHAEKVTSFCLRQISNSTWTRWFLKWGYPNNWMIFRGKSY